MSTISRYVLSQLLISFLITLVGMTFVLVFGVIVKEGMRQGLGLESILRLLPFGLPSALRFSVPASLLLAVCSVYGRMAFDNEVVASKSLGISPRVMLFPALSLGVFVSLGMIWLNDVAVTWGAAGMQAVIAESVEEVVFRLLKTEKSFRNGHMELYVKQVQGRKLIEPHVKLINGKNRIDVHAREAELKTDLEKQILTISLVDLILNSQRDGMDGFGFANSGVNKYEIPLAHATRKDTRTARVSELGLSRISSETVKQQAHIRSIEQSLAARAAFQMVTGDFGGLGVTNSHPDGFNWNTLYKQHRDSKSRLNRLHLEPWRRCAEGFSCLFIVVVGAPLAIRMRTNNFFTTFAMCFFPVLCVYYPILQWTVEQVKDGGVPPYLVWLGNGVLGVVGGWLTRGIVRY